MQRRIACLVLPQFSVEVCLRTKPSLKGRPIAIAQGEARREIVCAGRTSIGVVPGMTPKQARAACPGLVVVARDENAELAATSELLDALETCGPLVEGSAPGICYFDAALLPGGEAAALGAAVSLASELGFTCAAAIADDKFSARCAALVAGGGVSIVPAGGAAAFLAPLSINLLALAAGDAQRLDLLGLRTLGQLAALPAGPLALRFGERARRYRQLARGADDEPLQPRSVTAHYENRFAFDGAVDRLEPVLFALRGCLATVAARLAGCAQTCDRFDVALEFSAESVTVPVLLAEPTASAETMFHLARIALESREMLESIAAIAVRVTPCGQAPPQLSLFDGSAASRKAAVAATIARLQAALGRDEVVTMVPAPARSRLPERMQQATPIQSPRDLELAGAARSRNARTVRSADARVRVAVPWKARVQEPGLALRKAEPPPHEAGLSNGAIAPTGRANGITTPARGAWAPALRLVDPPKPIAAPAPNATRAGPFRLSESWWEHGVERDYYQLVDTAGALVLVFRDLRDGCWYLQGVFD
ncbi:MAG: DNA polymerase Y family protein [Candidatus Eremiobacteraeota bacterium]|nr:DNA polymerase Y family protein [Candidatus Eremiobacteraeota bacterium]